ncbi:hypothetical protein FQV27_18450 [Paracoccus aurantiacus]|uniref:Uncharacterized protein n=1 Tax=Paracoccus aurantiacus TaxID=2599412 RepID=A0A5C6RMU9_9RHOB|nr:hypothetical protein [Paracoccus aurantiacus]TXB63636.1 hypothetical protein FQV27_18450 [Paracoccus aurantiacus]
MSPISFNGLSAGDSPASFRRFCVSPVRIERGNHYDEAIEVCPPAERAFWSIYGDSGQGWQLVHDAQDGEAGRALLALEVATGAPVHYVDCDWRSTGGTVAGLADRLAERIHDEIPGYDGPEDFRDDDFENHPLAELRELLLDATNGEDQK